MSRSARLVLWLAWGSSLLLAVLTLTVGRRAVSPVPADLIFFSSLIGTIGLVVLVRSPNQRVGWLLIAIGFWGTLLGFSEQYAELAYVVDPDGAFPLKWVSAWIANWGWFPLLGLALMILPQAFPSGRPLPGRWKAVYQVTSIYVVVFAILLAFGNAPLQILDESLPNPVGFLPTERIVGTPAYEPLTIAPLVGSLLVSWVSLAVRYGRSRGNERQQIKWIAFAISAVLGTFVVGAILSVILEGDCCNLDRFGPVLDVLSTLAFLGLPVSIGISILRYRLYDIDRIIRRTLSYTILTVILALTYFGGILLFQRIVPAQSQLAIVVSTLATAALFSPLRRTVQASIDQRFYRNRTDPEKALGAFRMALGRRVDSDEIGEAMLDFIEETVKPEHASVWLRQHPRLPTSAGR